MTCLRAKNQSFVKFLCYDLTESFCKDIPGHPHSYHSEVEISIGIQFRARHENSLRSLIGFGWDSFPYLTVYNVWQIGAPMTNSLQALRDRRDHLAASLARVDDLRARLSDGTFP